MTQQLKDNAHPLLPAHLLGRLPGAQAIAETRAKTINGRMQERHAELNKQLSSAQQENISKKGRLNKLRKLASDIGKLATDQSACRKGCSHCCYIPVALFQSEANLIAEEIKKPARQLEGASLPSAQGYGYHMPCPFLKAGSCSIYAHRPLACRTHVNLDADALLCELLPEMTVPVPLLDMTVVQQVYVQLCLGDVLADIRDFFPPANPEGPRKP